MSTITRATSCYAKAASLEIARAQCGTIRLKLLTFGAQVRVTVWNIWIALSESYPFRAFFVDTWHRLAPT